MDRADRYILRQFIQTFIFGNVAFIVIYIVVHLIEHIDDFSDKNATTPLILQYYVWFIPEIVKLVAPISMLLAGLFTFNKLDATHELTALRAAGRSMRRIAVPLLLLGLLVGGSMIWFNGYLVPEANRKRFELERIQLGGNISGGVGDLHLRLSPTLNLQVGFYDASQKKGTTISLERTDTAALLPVPTVHPEGNKVRITGDDTIRAIAVVERIDALTMEYDTTKKVWVLKEGVARNLRDPEKVVSTPFAERVMEALPITPESLNLSGQKTDEMTLDELWGRIEQERSGGRDVRNLLIDYYSRFSFPFAAFIVVFFGIPFSSGQRKGGAAVPIALTALISAIYMVFTEVSKTLSYSADLPPVVTAWIANAIFLVVGIVNLWRIERG